jgi:hypothetical protein
LRRRGEPASPFLFFGGRFTAKDAKENRKASL